MGKIMFLVLVFLVVGAGMIYFDAAHPQGFVEGVSGWVVALSENVYSVGEHAVEEYDWLPSEAGNASDAH